jgi:hypothetical protein
MLARCAVFCDSVAGHGACGLATFLRYLRGALLRSPG